MKRVRVDGENVWSRRMMLNSHSTAKGPTIFQRLERNMIRACRRYLNMKADGSDMEVAIQRGIVRGMASQLALFVGPWEDTLDTTATVEKYYMGKTRNNDHLLGR